MSRFEPIIAPLRAYSPRLAALIEPRLGFIVKALTFGTIGVFNTAVDYGFFLLADAYLAASPRALAALAQASDACQCVSPYSARLIAANGMSWIIAVTGSFLLNSMITFASVTGRKLTWRAYGAFIASNIVGFLCATATLTVAARFLPPWAAKLCAIPVSFIVNFSLAHFVVFRPRPQV